MMRFCCSQSDICGKQMNMHYAIIGFNIFAPQVTHLDSWFEFCAENEIPMDNRSKILQF